MLADENIATATGCSQSDSAIAKELGYGRCPVTRNACGLGDDASYDCNSVTGKDIELSVHLTKADLDVISDAQPFQKHMQIGYCTVIVKET